MGSSPISWSPRKRHALELFAGLPRHYDAMGALLSFGQDPRWRHALVGAIEAGRSDRVLDVASGTGLVAAELVRRHGCRVVAVDQSAQMLARSRERFDADPSLGARVELVEGVAEDLPFGDGEFDALTFTYLLRYVDDVAATLGELARVVKPGGSIAALEFGVPTGRATHPLWRLYTRAGMPALGRLVSRDWYEVGRFLGPSISRFDVEHPLGELERLWGGAGIEDVRTRRMSFGAGVVTSGRRARA